MNSLLPPVSGVSIPTPPVIIDEWITDYSQLPPSTEENQKCAACSHTKLFRKVMGQSLIERAVGIVFGATALLYAAGTTSDVLNGRLSITKILFTGLLTTISHDALQIGYNHRYMVKSGPSFSDFTLLAKSFWNYGLNEDALKIGARDISLKGSWVAQYIIPTTLESEAEDLDL